MDKIKTIYIENLINDITKKQSEGAVVVKYDGLEDLTDAMGMDYNLLYYTDVNHFMKMIQEHKLIQWNKLSFIIKDKKIVFFKYINMEIKNKKAN